jgi:hypothetical protein
MKITSMKDATTVGFKAKKALDPGVSPIDHDPREFGLH